MALDGGTIADTAVEVVADTGRFEPEVKRKLDQAGAAAGKAFDRSVKKETDTTGKAVGEKVAREAQTPARQAGISWGDAFRIGIASRLSNTQVRQIMRPFSALAGVMAFSAITAGAASAGAGVLVFAAALGQLAGAALAVPAALAVGGAAVGTLRVATMGLGAAFTAAAEGDAKAFQKAVEDMSPAARKVAEEFRALVPQLYEVRDAVQAEFWTRLHGQLTAVAGVLLGPLGQGMTLVAGSSAAVALGIASILQEAQTAQLLAAVFDTTAASIDRVNPGVLAIVRGLRDLTGVGLPLMTQLSGSVAGLAVDFGEWLSRISQSGQAWAWIQEAMAGLRELGVVFQQIGGIIAAIMSAAQQSSGGLLGTLGQLLTGVNAFLSSAQGQQLLLVIFQTLAAVGQALLPVLLALGGALTLVAPQLASIATAVGPGLAAAVTALGPAIAALGPGVAALAAGLAAAFADPAMAAGLLALGQALAQVMVALTPLLPVLGQLVVLVATILARALILLAPIIRVVAEALAFLLPPVLSLVDKAYGLAFAFGQWLQFSALPGILDGIGTAAQRVGAFFAGLWQAVSSIDLGGAVGAVGSFVDGVLAWFAGLPAQIGGFLVSIGSTVLDFFLSLPGLVVQGLAALPGLLLDALVFAAEAVGYGIGFVLALVVGLPVLIYNALMGLGQLLANIMIAAWQWASNAVVSGAQAIVAFAIALPGMIINGLAALGSMLAGWASAAWAWASGAFAAGIGTVVGWAIGLPGRVVSALANLGSMLAGWASSAWSWASNAFSTGVSNIISFVSGLPGRILSALGNLGSLLYNAGSQIIQGLLNGLKSAVGQVWDFVGSIGDKIASLKGPLPYDRVMLIPHGRAIMAGLDEGIRKEFTATVEPTLRGLTAAMPRKLALNVHTAPVPARPSAIRNGVALTPSLVPRGGTTTVHHHNTQVNAPITVKTAARDPRIVARRTADEVARLGQG